MCLGRRHGTIYIIWPVQIILTKRQITVIKGNILSGKLLSGGKSSVKSVKDMDNSGDRWAWHVATLQHGGSVVAKLPHMVG